MDRKAAERKLILLREQKARGDKEIERISLVGSGYDEFWTTKKRYRVVKGGRSSKKSTTTAMWYVWNMMKYPLSNTLVVRKTGNTHEGSTFPEIKKACKRFNVIDKWKFTEKPCEATYIPTGQKILFRGFDEPLKLTSVTVDVGVLCWVWFEETYEIESEADFNTLDEGIRGEMPQGLWKQLTLTYNPWVNSHWTKTRFFDNTDPHAFTLTTTHKCNEFLDQADHDKIEELASSDPDRYKVVGLGDYGIPGGTYFEEFRSDIHTLDSFVIPEYWHKYRTIDYGLDMLVCLWIAIDTHGQAFVYKELYESNLIISEAAKRILEINGTDNILTSYAPPDLFNRRQETGKSAIEIFADNKVYFVKSSNDRVQGWYNVKEWIKPYLIRDEQTGEEIKTSKLKIFKNCYNLIRTLPQLQCDPRDPNDVSNEPHELTHAPDALRGFCTTRPITTAIIDKSKWPKYSREWYIEKQLKEIKERKNKREWV